MLRDRYSKRQLAGGNDVLIRSRGKSIYGDRSELTKNDAVPALSPMSRGSFNEDAYARRPTSKTGRGHGKRKKSN